MPKAKAAAITALNLDPSLAEAHTAMGIIQLFFDRDWAASEKAFRRAIELNPNYAGAYVGLGCNLTSSGRDKDGVAQFRKAVELDPLSMYANNWLGLALLFTDQYDETIHKAARCCRWRRSLRPPTPDGL
jgi:serine/threonine-protein kinase